MNKSEEIRKPSLPSNIIQRKFVGKKKNSKIEINNDRDHKITQYYSYSNTNQNNIKENKINLNESESKIKKEEENFKKDDSIIKKRNYRAFKSEKNNLNEIIQVITKIYEDYVKTKNITSIEKLFMNFINDKIIHDDNNYLPPIAQSEEGSILMENPYFWLLLIEIKLSKDPIESRPELFFDLFESATECCDYDKLVLINYFYDHINRNMSKADVITRMKKMKLSDEFLDKFSLTDSLCKDYKYAIKNYSFFENEYYIDDKSSLRKKKKINQEFTHTKEKENLKSPEVSKNNVETSIKILSPQKNLINNTLDNKSDIDEKFSDCLKNISDGTTVEKLKIEKNVQIELKNISKIEKISKKLQIFTEFTTSNLEIANVENLSISSNNINCNTSLTIEKTNLFTLFPIQKVKKRISFVNNYQQNDFNFSNLSMKRDNYLDVTIWKKIEMYKEDESYNSTKTKRSKSSDSDAFDSKIKKEFGLANPDMNNEKSEISDDEIIFPDKSKILDFVYSSFKKSDLSPNSNNKRK